MTERLEQEWKSYCEKQGNGTMISVNAKDVAQHFYNLALEDVRKECEKRINEYNESIEKNAKQKSLRAERDAWKWAECKSIIKFINSINN